MITSHTFDSAMIALTLRAHLRCVNFRDAKICRFLRKRCGVRKCTPRISTSSLLGLRCSNALWQLESMLQLERRQGAFYWVGVVTLLLPQYFPNNNQPLISPRQSFVINGCHENSPYFMVINSLSSNLPIIINC